MNSFYFCNPTKIFFGQNSIENLENLLKDYNNILLAYGGGSIKKAGIYDKVKEILKHKNVFELSGIMPNPRKEKVYEGIEICKMKNIDFVLAVGGGSTIDCSKAIAAGALIEEDFWDYFYLKRNECRSSLPMGAILTLSATGSEMNGTAVISDFENNKKQGYDSAYFYPKFSILDPAYTFSLPQEQSIYGAIDILSHVFEVYFSPPDESNLSDDFAEAIIKNVMENIAEVLKNPHDYNARANLMWSSTMAINGIIKLSKAGDWEAHQIEHALSAFYDIPHGAGLAVVHPAYLEYIHKYAPKRFIRFAKNIWNIDTNGKTDSEIALESIKCLKEYFESLNAPKNLRDFNIPKSEIEKIAKTVNIRKLSYYQIDKEDIKNILYSAF